MKKVKFPYDYRTVPLKNVKGSATFTGEPSPELLEAVNKMAEIAFTKTKKNKTMKTGIELIAEERQEQIEKHGWDVINDEGYKDNELIKAALFAINSDVFEWPFYWMEEFRNKILAKPSKVERLRIAGALIAAEIDRLNNCSET